MDFLEDELDRFAAAVAAVDDVSLLVHNDGGSGGARGPQLQLQTREFSPERTVARHSTLSTTWQFKVRYMIWGERQKNTT